MVYTKYKYEKIDGPVHGVDGLDEKLVEIEGLCTGVLSRSAFLGLNNVYYGTLERSDWIPDYKLDENGEVVRPIELITFSGSGTPFSTDGDHLVAIAKYSEARNQVVTIQGVLHFDHLVNDPVRYGILVHDIKVGERKSCSFTQREDE